MRATLLSIALVSIAFFGCKKNVNQNNDTTPPPVADSTAMRYNINGITDRTLQWTDSVMIPLAITQTGGNQEKLSLSVTGLPPTVTATFDAQSGIPNFASVLTLHTNSTPGGKYNLKITGTTSRDSVKTYYMVLTINGEPPSCTKPGEYLCVQTSGSSPAINNDVTAVLTNVKNELLLKNCIRLEYPGPGQYVYVSVLLSLNCDNKTLKINEQPFPFGGTMTGDGTFTDNTLDFNVAGFHCVATLK